MDDSELLRNIKFIYISVREGHPVNGNLFFEFYGTGMDMLHDSGLTREAVKDFPTPQSEIYYTMFSKTDLDVLITQTKFIMLDYPDFDELKKKGESPPTNLGKGKPLNQIRLGKEEQAGLLKILNSY